MQRFKNPSRRFSAMGAVALLAGAALMGGCGGDDDDDLFGNNTIFGESGTAFGANVRTFATLGDNGQVRTVGFTLPLSAIQNASGENPAPFANLDFPQIVRETTFVDHLEAGWNEHGHPPQGVYEKPHFDFHFYNQTDAEVRAINCTDTTAPPESRVPAGYALPPTTAPGTCVPQMGFHASPGTDFAPGFNFTHSMILGYYGGELTFVEPMITRDFLLQKQNFTMEIPVPVNAGHHTLYPTRMTGTYDADSDSYIFELRDFVQVHPLGLSSA